MREVAHAAVDDVAGDRNHVGTKRFTRSTIASTKFALDGRAHVDVADLRDGEALQLRRKIGQRHFHADNAGHAARHEESDQVMTGVSTITPMAEPRIQALWPCGASARADTDETTSRTRVKTSSDEKKPTARSGSNTVHGGGPRESESCWQQPQAYRKQSPRPGPGRRR